MSVIYKVVTRPSDPRVPNSPKKYYPHLITLGQSVNLKYIAQKMQGYSSLSIGDIKSVIQNFVEKMKEQLLEGKSVNIEGLGVFMLTACSKGTDTAKDVTAKSVDSVRIFFQANKELRITKTATRADEKLDLISLDEYLKKLNASVTPDNPDDGENGGGGNEGGGDEEARIRLYNLKSLKKKGGKIYEENLECSFESNHCCSRCDCRSTGSTGCIIVSSIQ